MQIQSLSHLSELVTHAAYDPEASMLYLTYRNGNTTIAYQKVAPEVFTALRDSTYPDVQIRFTVQAKHSFRRVAAPYALLERGFIK